MNHIWSATQNALNMTSGVSVLEFDMKIDQMPAYPEAAIVYNSYLLVPGMNMVVIGNGAATANIGYIFGITNLEEKGLTLVIQHYDGSTFSDPTKVQMNKNVGEQFHVRMEYEPASHVLRAYCDDMLLWSGYGRGRPNAVSTKTGILSIYNSVVKNYVSKGSVQYTVSEFKTGFLKSGSPLDNLTVYDILGENTTAEAVGSNLSLPGFVTDPLLGSVDITWKSSDTSVVGDNGAVVLGAQGTVTIVIGEGSYMGTLVLSGTDWWGAGNAEDPLPMPENNVKSVNGKPDGNQGAVEVSNGWHLFDRYSETGTNPDGIRTYILFMKTSPYENFANRDGTTTAEFDFQAINMPVYTIEEAITTMTPNAYACRNIHLWYR